MAFEEGGGEWCGRRSMSGGKSGLFEECLQTRARHAGLDQTGQLENSIGADRATTERLLRSIGARKTEGVDEWVESPLMTLMPFAGLEDRQHRVDEADLAWAHVSPVQFGS